MLFITDLNMTNMNALLCISHNVLYVCVILINQLSYVNTDMYLLTNLFSRSVNKSTVLSSLVVFKPALMSTTYSYRYRYRCDSLNFGLGGGGSMKTIRIYSCLFLFFIIKCIEDSESEVIDIWLVPTSSLSITMWYKTYAEIVLYMLNGVHSAICEFVISLCCLKHDVIHWLIYACACFSIMFLRSCLDLVGSVCIECCLT